MTVCTLLQESPVSKELNILQIVIASILKFKLFVCIMHFFHGNHTKVVLLAIWKTLVARCQSFYTGVSYKSGMWDLNLMSWHGHVLILHHIWWWCWLLFVWLQYKLLKCTKNLNKMSWIFKFFFQRYLPSVFHRFPVSNS